MNVLVVGSGGREHALCWQLAASPLLGALWCAPGNAGIEREATCVPLDPMDFDGLVSFCRDHAIDFVVVGPEAPLCAGLVDRLEADGIAAFGPRKAAARIEGSKGFMKDLCARHSVPTAAYRRAASLADAEAFIAEQGAPVVVKADGLAAGKGVVLARTEEEALRAARAALEGAFGEAGTELVIEEMMAGEEASYFALVDGETVLPLETAQDHKAVGDGDTGPNTGGMGAYSPAPTMTPALCEEARTRIVEPLVRALAAEGTPYTGVFYAGLMLTAEGPKLLEVNVRFGDPECQVLLPRLRSDLLAALLAAHDGELRDFDLRWRDQAALCVVLATSGYPGAYRKGSAVRGIDAAEALGDVTVFHAGTARGDDGIVAAGGRVLGVTALGASVAAAQRLAYDAVERIDWPEGFCRRDIGWRAA
ncbi:MAG: phosphoribosylamine--glycine ligase [Rhodospirillales bacterium]|nr:phosphoribosylamine--glycine ligase [Rhodospirillales bacterium]MDE0377745.1 phosphoribosylamine--glycine ligase [Rhodospirillales bacterium]